MSNWNGLALQNEFAAEQSDVSTTGKARVLKWMSDIQQDICSRVRWDFLLKEGRKKLTASTKIQTLQLARPTAPTLALLAGGSLTDGTAVYVCVTYYESESGLESLAGISSAAATPTGATLSLTVTAIPVSLDPLVTSRKIYLKSGTGNFYYVKTIDDNTTVTTTITAATTSTIEPPDYSQIGKIIGNPNIIDCAPMSRRSAIQIRNLNSSWTTSGYPNLWTPMGYDKILVHPLPSSALEMCFFYKRNPAPMYAESDFIPELPIFLKEVLAAGVRMKGYFYSDRDGKIEQKNVYETLLAEEISKNGVGASGVYRVADVTGSSNGSEV